MTILISPLITEKTMLAASRGVYTFQAALNANKYQVKELVEELFSVHVTKVTTTIIKPAAKRTGRRRLPGKNTPTKVARVHLKPGESIALFDLKEDK